MAACGGFALVRIGTVVRDATDVPGSGVSDAADAGARKHASIEALRAQPVRIVIEARYAEALLGLTPGADILVLCYFDRADRTVLQVYPRHDRTRPRRGVFSTRSPARPNPIGVTTARILRIRGLVLEVVGLDALDGTPVIDIKDASEYFDRPYIEDLAQD